MRLRCQAAVFCLPLPRWPVDEQFGRVDDFDRSWLFGLGSSTCSNGICACRLFVGVDRGGRRGSLPSSIGSWGLVCCSCCCSNRRRTSLYISRVSTLCRSTVAHRSLSAMRPRNPLSVLYLVMVMWGASSCVPGAAKRWRHMRPKMMREWGLMVMCTTWEWVAPWVQIRVRSCAQMSPSRVASMA